MNPTLALRGNVLGRQPAGEAIRAIVSLVLLGQHVEHQPQLELCFVCDATDLVV
jgi:hypothetical protein